MRKYIVFALSFLILTTTSCSDKTFDTDLSSVFIDELQIGQSIQSVDLSIYTPTDRYKVFDDTLAFEELRITVANDTITSITGNCSSVSVQIKGAEIKTIDDVQEMLGQPITDSIYNREQHLKSYEYNNSEKSITAAFVYDSNSKLLVWVILEEAVKI